MRGSGREERKAVIETTGKSVEKALDKALSSLGAKVENVEIEILDAGQNIVRDVSPDMVVRSPSGVDQKPVRHLGDQFGGAPVEEFLIIGQGAGDRKVLVVTA